MANGTTSVASVPAREASWAQALPDVRADAEPFADVTLRSQLRAGIGGDRVRVEFSNRYGDQALVIGRVAVTCGGLSLPAFFDSGVGCSVPSGGSVWTDPVDLPVKGHAMLTIDFHLPEQTSFPMLFTSVSEFTGQMSEPGDHVGAEHFPAVAAPPFPIPDDADISVHESGPFLRTVDVMGPDRHAVVVCLGDSITAMGWPEAAAGLLPVGEGVSIVNRGIAGNRLRLDAGAPYRSNGRSGLHRFADDVLATSGVAHVVVALGTNDLGLPGEFEPLHELPTADELIAAYQTLLDQASAAAIGASIATIGPRQGSDSYDGERERIRSTVNDWIRALGSRCIDFDQALRDPASPLTLHARYDSGDHLHPSDAGQMQLAATAISAVRHLNQRNP
ncbi:SGNH/GDSL hydrolase family protein [Kineosporia mesophila]|uniref:SGNH/GDSL hydrolase family protein n=1 Tax=Kineosporia mesophila TaxID=566012 RepID=A0ABP6ZZG6_9ACTN|nr:GDSL-type esterase/lipase family protein [Kineosporia mesophila]MCD5355065.1 GDSL-type esterase/lipase family protein [Kineosporia mesophila]